MIPHRLTIFILLLSSLLKTGFACGPFYPSNEAIRFHMLDMQVYNINGYELFEFSGHGIYLFKEDPQEVLQQDSFQSFTYQNIELWLNRCNYNCDPKDVYAALYFLNGEFKMQYSNNSFVKYLNEAKDSIALDYLQFADACEVLNDFTNDPWERHTNSLTPARQDNIRYACTMAQTVNDLEISQRYAFLALRLAFYNGDGETVQKLFDTYFADGGVKNLFYYWSLSFITRIEQDPVMKNYYASLIFKYAADKRYMASQEYDKKVPLDKTLRQAKTKEERAAVYMMDAYRNPGRSFNSIRNVYALDPKTNGLTFILLREINKLEYWIYTPYFQNYEASLSWDSNYSNWYSDQTESDPPLSLMQKRILADRSYARQLLAFVNTVQFGKTDDPDAWRMTQAYLMIMTEEFAVAENKIRVAQTKVEKGNPKWEQLELLRAFCVVALQADETVYLTGSIQPVVKRQGEKNNVSFLFGLARMLEFKGNTTEAALLLSKLNEADDTWEDDFIYWRTSKLHHTLYADFYDDYFFYLDAAYTTGELSDLIYAATHLKYKSDFSEWLYGDVQKEVPRLYDLLGTKYIRKNDLYNALKAFEKVDDSLYTSPAYPFLTYLNANPFYAHFTSGHSATPGDTIRYDKEGITKQLIEYLKQANDSTNADRDYYYFLVANCYYNMSFYGNSWMMRRYFSTMDAYKTGLPDDYEYFHCNLATIYYLKAKSYSNSKKFSALCLRMAGKCKHRSLEQDQEDHYRKSNDYSWMDNDHIFKINPYYIQLKTNYPKYYDELISNCYSFDSFFAAR